MDNFVDFSKLILFLLFREGKPENYQAIRACCRYIIFLILNVNNIFANISLVTIFCSRNEGVTVGGLSLAASYMAQVKMF